ncbi:MAG: hypothetical protein ABR552_09355 [Actinomycetota bacterium]|nr:hypothetical protein [Actinomycetota bacterium]
MDRSTRALAAVAVMAAVLSFSSARAGTQCTPVFVVAGSASVTYMDDKIVGANPGEVGCTAPGQPNTNKILPGAPQVWAAVSFESASSAPYAGTMWIGSTPHTLTWTQNPTRQRWESQAVSAGSTGNVTVTTTVNGTSYTVIYTR